ncbi:RadC family protein [Faucicola atlantae]|uniref:RadC family protein n=1 Tax=Faucicola atlantae TaxID=34059 RepID=UPI0025B0FA90|nr:DNA repair protein RadC [Moraxella atlantae]
MAIKDWHVDERPREKLLQKGADSLSDSEILAIFLRTGTKDKSAIELARDLIAKFGSLADLLAAPADEVMNHSGIGIAKYAQILASLEMGKRYLAAQVKQAPNLNSSQLVKDYLTTQLRPRRREEFAVLFLSNELTLIQFETLFTGGLSSCSVCVREVLRQALKYGASQLIIAHNHPATSAQPSKADIDLTHAIADACQLVDMQLLDHIIVGQDSTVSLRELGKF